MPEMLHHVEYLSQQIGPRPAGTEEEQQAALYITEQLQKEAGLSAVIEDFNSPSNSELPRVICAGVSIVAALFSLVIPVLLIPAIILTIVAALVVAAETFGKPIISPFFARGVSQNVVAKYEPAYSPEAATRRRKVIVVARYDSGKVRAELNGPTIRMMPVVNWVGFGGLVAIPVLLLVKALFLLNATGVPAVVLVILRVVAIVCAAVPVALAALHKLASYNEGANANASGVAVLMDVAYRVGRGRVSEEAAAASASAVALHGEEAARAEGLVPEGAQLVYEAASITPPEQAPQTQAERLTAAKAAIAALTGKPVNMETSLDISENLVQVKEPAPLQPSESDLAAQREEVRQALASVPVETMQTALQHAEGLQAAGELVGTAVAAAAVGGGASAIGADHVSDGGALSEEKDVPAWFKKAQAKAKKPKGNAPAPVHRSRYADAPAAALPEEVEQPEVARQEASEAEPQVVPTANPTQRMEPVAAAPSTEVPERVTSIPSEPVDPSAGTQISAPSVPAQQIFGVPELADPEVSMPSFLDPAKAQQEAASKQSPREEDRVSVAFDPASAGFDVVQPSNPKAIAAMEIPAVPSLQTAQRQPIALPDVEPSADLAPVEELQKQRAPLAEAAQGGKRALGRSLRSMLPSITGSITAESIAAAQANEQRPSLSAASIPSLSGALQRIEAPAASEGDDESQTTQFMPPVAGSAGMTGAFAPVGNELLQSVDPEDIYVDDADDSVYEESFTETGAFAGPGYVDMPKSRMSRLFGRFRRKKDEEPAPAAAEWLGVDEGFDARSVGAARGGWESFRSDDEEGGEQFIDASYDDSFGEEYDEGYNDGFVDVDYDSFADSDDRGFPSNAGRRWNGGAFSYDDMRAIQSGAPAVMPDMQLEEIQQIHQFRTPGINTEVWFVALGSELAGNAGMQAFLKEHEHDLRGAIVVELDSLGAGDLCLVEREGAYRKVKTSSRMQRIARKATQETGVKTSSASILWADSSASYATAHGVQAMHLVGMDGAKPAFFAQGNDVLENVDANLLEERAEYVMALLRNI